MSQQAHAIAAPPSRPRSRSGGGAASSRRRGGLLSPLLFTCPEDTPPPPPAALLGLRFCKRFGRMGSFEGAAVSHCPVKGYHLQYDDGDEEDVGVDELLALPLAQPDGLIGRRVSKHFVGHGRFEGVIGRYDRAQGCYAVTYDDGDAEHVSPPMVLRLLLPERPGKGGGKGAGKGKARACGASAGGKRVRGDNLPSAEMD